MPKLPPRVGTVDEKNFLKFVPLREIDFAFVGYLLACHLVIEHYLDEFLLSRAPELTWDGSKMTFSQKTALFPHSIFPNGAEVIGAIRHLNAIRNSLAHRLETRPEDLEYLPLIRLLEKSNVEDIPTEPTMILAYFMGWFASDAYRTTWRQVKQKSKGQEAIAWV